MAPTVVTLSCEQCRRRKTKCDKKSPCTACQQAAISCTTIQRPRRPRGRHARAKRHDEVINSKISQLEDLVRSFGTRIQEQPQDPNREAYLPPVPIKAQTILARDFFETIAQHVGDIRNAIDEQETEDSDDDDTSAELSKTTSDSMPGGQRMMTGALFDLGNSCGLGYQQPSDSNRKILVDIFVRRVDCVFKIAFVPGVTAAFGDIYSSEGPSPAMTRVVTFEALERAIYFLSVCIMTENEVRMMLREDKETLVAQYQHGLELAMARHGLLTNPDKLVVEAFVMYLMGLRIRRKYSIGWTLLPVAIRIASAIGLPLPDKTTAEETNGLEPVTGCREEIYQRIWCCIGVLDTMTSRDRGTRVLIPSKGFSRRLMLVNDEDCQAANTGQIPALQTRTGFTDMSFTDLTHEAMVCARQLAEIPESPRGDWTSWNQRMRIVESFEARVRAAHTGLNNHTDPFARLVAFTAEESILEMKLLLRRPALRFSGNPIPPFDDFDVLQCTTEIIEKNLTKITDSSFAQWSWYFQTWPKSHVLVAHLAELCVPRNDNLAEHAYYVAKQGYEHCATMMANSDLLPVWKFIRKLMRKVDVVRATVLAARESSQNGESLNRGTSTEYPSSATDLTSMSVSTGFTPAPDGNIQWTDMNLLEDPSVMDMMDPLPDVGLNSNIDNETLWNNWDTFLQEMGDPFASSDPFANVNQ